MSKISDYLEKIKESDAYSLILFALYKLMDVAEYSSLSELAYVLDKDNLLNFCEYFGGMTIKVPTVEELEDVVSALLVFEYVDVNNYDLEEAINLVNSSTDKRKLRNDYLKLKAVLENYEFTIR